MTDPIVSAVIADLQERSAKGVATYGTTLARTDLTREEWTRHAYEEALDLALYLRRLMQEPSGWQPIETAPKDEVIDLWCSLDDVRYANSWWSSEGWTDGDEAYGDYPDFTHWRPLPTPPDDARARPAEPVSAPESTTDTPTPCTALSGEKNGQCACLWEYLNAWRKEPAG